MTVLSTLFSKLLRFTAIKHCVLQSHLLGVLFSQRLQLTSAANPLLVMSKDKQLHNPDMTSSTNHKGYLSSVQLLINTLDDQVLLYIFKRQNRQSSMPTHHTTSC